MSDLEARIAEVLAEHDWYDASTDNEDPAIGCHGCDEWFADEYAVTDGTFVAHLAAMLAPVIREREAAAWDACVHAADKQWTIGHTSAQLLRIANPYRADNLGKP